MAGAASPAESAQRRPRIRLIVPHDDGPLTRPLDLLALFVQLGTGRGAAQTIFAAHFKSQLLMWLASCDIAVAVAIHGVIMPWKRALLLHPQQSASLDRIGHGYWTI
jgi:hypothetical protein